MRSPRKARHPVARGAHKTKKARKKPVAHRKAAHHKAAAPASHAHRVRKH